VPFPVSGVFLFFFLHLFVVFPFIANFITFGTPLFPAKSPPSSRFFLLFFPHLLCQSLSFPVFLSSIFSLVSVFVSTVLFGFVRFKGAIAPPHGVPVLCRCLEFFRGKCPPPPLIPRDNSKFFFFTFQGVFFSLCDESFSLFRAGSPPPNLCNPFLGPPGRVDQSSPPFNPQMIVPVSRRFCSHPCEGLTCCLVGDDQPFEIYISACPVPPPTREQPFVVRGPISSPGGGSNKGTLVAFGFYSLSLGWGHHFFFLQHPTYRVSSNFRFPRFFPSLFK